MIKHDCRQSERSIETKKLIMSGNVLKVLVSNDIERNHFDKACNGSLVKAFRQCGFEIDKVVLKQIQQITMMTLHR